MSVSLLEKYPRQALLFILGVLLGTAYIILLLRGINDEVIKTLLIACVGGLIADLTGNRSGGTDVQIDRAHIDVQKE